MIFFLYIYENTALILIVLSVGYSVTMYKLLHLGKCPR